MSLLFDVLKRQEPASDIPETDLPDEKDLADVRVKPPADRTDSEIAESIALQLEESVAATTAVDATATADSIPPAAEQSLELEVEVLSEGLGAAASDATVHEHALRVQASESSAAAVSETLVAPGGQSATPTMWRRRPKVEWALIVLFVVAVLAVTIFFFTEPESNAALAPTVVLEVESAPSSVTAPAATTKQPADDTAVTSGTLPAAAVTGGDGQRDNRVFEEPRPNETAPALPSPPDNEQVARPASGVTVMRTRAEDPVFTALSHAYSAYQSGDDATALAQYRMAAALDPNNRDALLGLAAMAQRQGDLPEARRHYQRLLDLDPKDSVVISAMLALRDDRSRINDESWLKSMLREEPRAAHLHFGLGLRYAAQERWPDAQGSFFEAVRHAPQNPDYNFNLAVTLDRLGKQRLAADYYQRAIQYATGAQSFDIDAAMMRLKAISRTGQG